MTEEKQDSAPPREMDEIQKEYDGLCAEAGKCHYQIKVFERNLQNITDKIYAVNLEAAKRRTLNAQQEKAKNEVRQ